MAGAKSNLKEELDVAKLRVVTLISSAPRGGPPAKNLAQRYVPAVPSCVPDGSRPPFSTALHLCSLIGHGRWIQFVDAANSGTVQAAEEAYIRFLIALDEMQLVVSAVSCKQLHERWLQPG